MDIKLLKRQEVAPPPLALGSAWRPLRLFNLYRLTLSGLFVVISTLGQLPPPLGQAHPSLFYNVSLIYVLFTIVAGLAINRRQPRFNLQVYAQVSVDIVLITTLMHASGGLSSNLGTLLVVSIASASLLISGRAALFFAALASLAILVEQVYINLSDTAVSSSYPQAGLLGITLFATAIIAHVLARRARESEALAAQRGVDLANMDQLTEYVIQHMQTGVLVTDAQLRLRLMNTAAWRLLGQPSAIHQRTLASVSSSLHQRLLNWQLGKDAENSAMTIAGSNTEILPIFAGIGEKNSAGFLIFLEDASSAAKQVQQIKLAALGRLTAGIAHEIRNPLGAISHAGELLAESPSLEAADKRFTEIIHEQSLRINTIIENVLQLGRKDKSQAENLELTPLLERFTVELAANNEICTDKTRAADIELNVTPKDLAVQFDPSHLHQILWNLCENGLHHARNNNKQPKLELKAGLSADGIAWLDIIDNGPGVAKEHIANIFEPFFTTEAKGTGLGLYLSRELADCNHARLEYISKQDNPSCFRLSFLNTVTPDPHS